MRAARMKRGLLTALLLLVLAAGCHHGERVTRPSDPGDIVGIYARQHGITREQAEQQIQHEAAEARANAAGHTAGRASSGTPALVPPNDPRVSFVR